MDDFSPEKIAERIDGLKEFLASRKQLDALRTSIAGKAATERLLSEALSSVKDGDRSLFEALAAKKDASGPDDPKANP
jgi:type VI secretion system protein ImpB